MQQRSLGGGKGHQGPHMGTGTSREMFLQQCRGAWVHGCIAADGFDPGAATGSCHENKASRVLDRAMMVDRAGLPELLGVFEGARRRNQVIRLPINENTNEHETEIRRTNRSREIDTKIRRTNRSREIHTNRSREIDIANDRSMYVTIAHAVMIENARNSIEQHDTNTNTNTNTRMPRPYCACSQVTYEWCHCRCMTRVPRSPCAVQELVAAGAVTGEKMRETRGKAAGSGPPSRGLVGWVSLLGVSTTMPLVAHENRNSHTLTHIENARNSIEQHDTSTNTNTNTNTNTRMPRPYCACSQVTYEWCHCRCVTRVPRSPCAVQEMDAAEAAAGGKPRGTRGKAAGDAPLSRGIVGWVSLLGADSTTMPLVDNENRKSHTLTHIEARRGEAVHAASAAHAALDAPALIPTYQTGGSRCKPMQSDKRAKGGIKIQSTKWEKEGEQRQARQGGSELPPRQLRAKQPDSKQHIADF